MTQVRKRSPARKPSPPPAPPSRGTPFTISMALTCKLASIVAHVDEGFSSQGHAFDIAALRALIDNTDVRQWLAKMRRLGFVPVKR
jgi:hypothetical protein